MKIAILGGGNGSYAAAADLADQGHEVRLWRRDIKGVQALQENHNTLGLKDFQSERKVVLYEGTQASVRRVTTRLDNERIAVREALGYQAPHFPLANHYDNEAEEWSVFAWSG